MSPIDGRIPENPIGKLQEMCMSRYWPCPHYEILKWEGLPHDPLFTIVCKVLFHQEYGKLEVCVALGTLSTVYRRDVCWTYYLWIKGLWICQCDKIGFFLVDDSLSRNKEYYILWYYCTNGHVITWGYLHYCKANWTMHMCHCNNKKPRQLDHSHTPSQESNILPLGRCTCACPAVPCMQAHIVIYCMTGKC
jgi:hypothetical protein